MKKSNLIYKFEKSDVITLFIIIIIIIYEIILLFSCNFKSEFDIKSKNILLLNYIIKRSILILLTFEISVFQILNLQCFIRLGI